MRFMEAPTGVTGRDGYVINKAVSMAAEVWRSEEPPPEVDTDLLIACILCTAIKYQQALPEDQRARADEEDMRAILQVGYPEYAKKMLAIEH